MARIVRRHDLSDLTVAKLASWWHTDATSVARSRRSRTWDAAGELGFLGVRDTESLFTVCSPVFGPKGIVP